MPVAENCCVAPAIKFAFVGLTSMLVRVGSSTLKLAELDTPARLAVMSVVPTASAVAKPLFPAVLLIEATPLLEDAHITWPEISRVVESEYVPVATYCLVTPL